eukprot:2618718-Prymnesium_polylepis.2
MRVDARRGRRAAAAAAAKASAQSRAACAHARRAGLAGTHSLARVPQAADRAAHGRKVGLQARLPLELALDLVEH